jgi:Zn ribbon nucleic-acid-binding protein
MFRLEVNYINMVIKRFCPQCSSEDVDFSTEEEGNMLCCQNCGFSDISFPEHDVGDISEDDEILKDINDVVAQIKKKAVKPKTGKKTAKKKGGKKNK